MLNQLKYMFLLYQGPHPNELLAQKIFILAQHLCITLEALIEIVA